MNTCNIKNIKYKNKFRFLKHKNLKLTPIKQQLTFEQFQLHYMRDFYTMKERSALKKFLHISEAELKYSLCNQHVLLKYFKRKYYSYFKKKAKIFVKTKYSKKYRLSVKKRKRKKKINLRFKKFFRINYDNFLFYLNFTNKQVIIKPFNFLHCLFFFKTKFFQKRQYIIRKRRKHTKLYYKLLRIRGKRRLRRRRIKRIKYRLKKRILFKRFKLRKFKLFKNFFRVIAFMNVLKKKTLSIDDHFKIKSSSRLRYKFLKFYFNKINNSYQFFMHLKRRKLKIKLFVSKISAIKQKIKLFNMSIKIKLKNRFINHNNKNKIINNNKLHLLIFNTNKKFNDLDLIKNNEVIKFKNDKNSFINENNNFFPDYLILTNLIKKKIKGDFFVNSKKKNIYSNKFSKLIFIIKLINKLSKKILFFERKIIKIKFKQKKRVLRLSVKLLKINLEILKKFEKLKKVIKKLLYIIIKLKEKLKNLILNFLIFFSFLKRKRKLKNLKLNFLKKINYILKKKNKKYNILKKRKHLFSILSLDWHRKIIVSDNKCFIYSSSPMKKFSIVDKLFNQKPDWLLDLSRSKQQRRKIKTWLRFVKKHWNLSNSFFYKNYFNNKSSLTNNFYSFFFFEKFKTNYLNFLKKKNLFYFKNIQKKKNIEFLK